MKRTVESGKTLLVDGPASVTIVSGKVEVFGSALGGTTKVVIREGKRLPFTVKETTTVDISLGENAYIEEVDENTIPSSWTKAYEELLAIQTRSPTALVLGAIDSGKTSFCTYLTNKLLSKKQKVVVLDGDLGQSDIGPPCTVAYAFVTRPITDLFNLEAKNAFFVGVTSPSKFAEKVIEGLVLLKKEVLSSNPDFIIVNTDGWVEGENAVNYKVQLSEKLSPNIILCIQQKNELTPLLNALEKFKRVIVDSPSVIRQRSREKRKSLRELGYVKYLKNAKMRFVPLSWLKIEDGELIGLSKNRWNLKLEKTISELLGTKPIHLAEFPNKIFIVIGRGYRVDPENVRRIEELTGKKVVTAWKGEEKGLLMALYGDKGNFLGIGVLQDIHYKRKTMKIYTPVSDGISIITIGKVKLDKNLKEISQVPAEEKQPKL
jgi:polynucleotide 5'-hydroxyl-kinase GRC3/NOL9